MANHSIIKLKILHTLGETEEVLRVAVKDALGEGLEVTPMPELRPQWPGAAGLWFVHLPGTKPVSKMHPEDYGFVVAFNNDPKHDAQEWEFRHPVQMWCYWAQSRLQCTLAQQYGVQIYDEGEEDYEDPDPEILAHPTYADYLCRNFEKPLNEEDRVWIERCLQDAPPQFRELPSAALPRTSGQL